MSGARIFQSPIGVSARHVHLTQSHILSLFGGELHVDRMLSQTGEFAAVERVSLASEHGILKGVRVLGPARPHTQIEISKSDSFSLGITVPVRLSGDIEGTPGLTIIGPGGTVVTPTGTIVASRHLHISTKDAARLNLKTGDRIAARVFGRRACVFEDVIVRVAETGVMELHLDTDEANAADLSSGDVADMVIPEPLPDGLSENRYICVEDIEKLIRAGGRLRLKPGQKITSSALELARSRQVLIH